jgi:phosphatidylserine/phosphatidylglycerophosphate/cardiolipin synthase-like enzyme
MKKIFSLLFVFSILLSACGATPTPVDADAASDSVTEVATDQATNESAPLVEVSLGAGYGVRGPWFEVYFTDPLSPLASQTTGGPDLFLAQAIDSARLSVDVAVYSLSLNSIRNALINAHKRGVRVRVVMESDNLDRSDPQRIKDAGLPILGDRQQGLMHNKFVVIDGYEVWLGSMNFTDSGGYTDNNNLVRIQSKKVAENYTKEFEEMFVNDKFGQNVVAETPNPFVEIDGTPINIYFSPDDGAQAALLELINNAQDNIRFMAFSFTADSIGAAIRTRAEEGIEVSGVMEEEQINSNVGTEFDPFKQAGLDVKRDGNDGQMHHKTMIIDDEIVVLGSYNFTNSAETRNDENMMVIYNKEIAAQFLSEFERVYSQSK